VLILFLVILEINLFKYLTTILTYVIIIIEKKRGQ
jgi:hypothetical protein